MAIVTRFGFKICRSRATSLDSPAPAEAQRATVRAAAKATFKARCEVIMDSFRLCRGTKSAADLGFLSPQYSRSGGDTHAERHIKTRLSSTMKISTRGFPGAFARWSEICAGRRAGARRLPSACGPRG